MICLADNSGDGCDNNDGRVFCRHVRLLNRGGLFNSDGHWRVKTVYCCLCFDCSLRQ
jgi:hypothetical protein